jgi:hypothetical protein
LEYSLALKSPSGPPPDSTCMGIDERTRSVHAVPTCEHSYTRPV